MVVAGRQINARGAGRDFKLGHVHALRQVGDLGAHVIDRLIVHNTIGQIQVDAALGLFNCP